MASSPSCACLRVKDGSEEMYVQLWRNPRRLYRPWSLVKLWHHTEQPGGETPRWRWTKHWFHSPPGPLAAMSKWVLWLSQFPSEFCQTSSDNCPLSERKLLKAVESGSGCQQVLGSQGWYCLDKQNPSVTTYWVWCDSYRDTWSAQFSKATSEGCLIPSSGCLPGVFTSERSCKWSQKPRATTKRTSTGEMGVTVWVSTWRKKTAITFSLGLVV